jgi:hypothetical protein
MVATKGSPKNAKGCFRSVSWSLDLGRRGGVSNMVEEGTALLSRERQSCREDGGACHRLETKLPLDRSGIGRDSRIQWSGAESCHGAVVRSW